MSEVVLPGVRPGKNDKETIQNLYDAYYRLRKELDFTLQNLDGMNIDKAYVNSLEVGTDIKMGPNAVLSWGQVTEAPDFTTQGELYTILGYDYIITGKIYASQINGNIANLAEGVNIGNIGSPGEKYIRFFDGSNQDTEIKSISGDLAINSDGTTYLNSFDRLELYGRNEVYINSGFGAQTTFGGLVNFSGAMVTGLNFASTSHDHGTTYVKSKWGQDLSWAYEASTKKMYLRYNDSIIGYVTLI